MPWKEVRIILREDYTGYPHNASLCYENEKDYIENFKNPIEKAREMKNGDITIIEVPHGAIEAKRHFNVDYREDKSFEITISNKVKISHAYFVFEKDDSVEARYDDMFIKNIKIQFRNSDCSALEE